MTSTEFRNNQLLVDGARKIFEDPVFKQMLEIMDAESPIRGNVADTTPNETAVAYGMVVGYANYALRLTQFTIRALPNQVLIPDYGTYTVKSQTQ